MVARDDGRARPRWSAAYRRAGTPALPVVRSSSAVPSVSVTRRLRRARRTSPPCAAAAPPAWRRPAAPPTRGAPRQARGQHVITPSGAGDLEPGGPAGFANRRGQSALEQAMGPGLAVERAVGHGRVVSEEAQPEFGHLRLQPLPQPRQLSGARGRTRCTCSQAAPAPRAFSVVSRTPSSSWSAASGALAMGLTCGGRRSQAGEVAPVAVQ
jgi:hypothetical protein